MTISQFYPPAIYHFLLNLAHNNGGLSIKEVETVLLREQIGLMGFTCDHHNVGFAKRTKRPYCKDCWTRLRQVSQRVYNYETKKWTTNIEFLPIVTFLDTFTNVYKKEDKKSEDIESEQETKNNNERLENI